MSTRRTVTIASLVLSILYACWFYNSWHRIHSPKFASNKVYGFQPLLPSGWKSSEAVALNDSGMVLLKGRDSEGDERACLWTNDAVVHEIEIQSATLGVVDLNNKGQVLGNYESSEKGAGIFVWSIENGLTTVDHSNIGSGLEPGLIPIGERITDNQKVLLGVEMDARNRKFGTTSIHFLAGLVLESSGRARLEEPSKQMLNIGGMNRNGWFYSDDGNEIQGDDLSLKIETDLEKEYGGDGWEKRIQLGALNDRNEVIGTIDAFITENDGWNTFTTEERIAGAYIWSETAGMKIYPRSPTSKTAWNSRFISFNNRHEAICELPEAIWDYYSANPSTVKEFFFIWENGEWYPLAQQISTDLNPAIKMVIGVNNNGLIAGAAVVEDERVGFLLRPMEDTGQERKPM